MATAQADVLLTELLARGLAPSTVRLYLRTLRRAETWWAEQGWSLERATADEVAAFLRTWPASWASRNLLRAAFRHYWEIHEHPKPPLRALRVPPKPAMVCKALSPDSARLLAKAALARNDLHGFAVVLGLYEGLRREEIAGLPWSAFQSGWITVTGKGSKTATIPEHSVVATMRQAMPNGSPFVFPGRFGGHVHPATIWHWVKAISVEAGLPPVTTHVLRHLCLATANDATGDLRGTQSLARHSRPETTAGYTRTTGQRLKVIIEAVRYD